MMLSESTMAVVMRALEKANQLVEIATDWNLDEVEIDGEMISTYSLKDTFDAAITELQAAQAGGWEPLSDGDYQLVCGGSVTISAPGLDVVDRFEHWAQVHTGDYRLCEYIGSQEGRNAN